MEYNLKDYFKGEKLEEQILKYSKSHPNTSTKEVDTLKEIFQNLSEEDKNELIYEASNNKAKRVWTKLSIVVFILGVSVAYITKSWWPVIASIVLIPVFMVVLIYCNTKYLEKYADISFDEQEILNKVPWLEEQSEPKEGEEFGRENL